ncbi:hypothetical protein GH714_042902 [Hevea brasiliensis]|uniref:Msp4/OMP-like domain-containing protein n=1 Tax=Hevea brasiliensis TaxID=3981 RepID=A0A6A6K1P8_HEVBR|nr:hypothetical protein GH714_042902 [Hevea brasiliensis]
MVAGAFARAVEGAEVIEVRAIGSTSVMLNACYDLLTDGIGVVPYACAGVGGNFVSVVDGHINPKFAYRVKAGLSYALTPEISAFAGAFYHKVLGDGDYDELPLSPIADYTGPAGKNKDTGIASFTFAYFGGELGVRKASTPTQTYWYHQSHPVGTSSTTKSGIATINVALPAPKALGTTY